MGLGHSGTGTLWVWDTVGLVRYGFGTQWDRVRCIGMAPLILTVGRPTLSQLPGGSSSITDLTLKCARTSTTTVPRGYNNNNRLFVVPHLVRAQGAYKDIWIHSFHHTHTHACARTHTRTRTHPDTHTLHIHALLVMDW